MVHLVFRVYGGTSGNTQTGIVVHIAHDAYYGIRGLGPFRTCFHIVIPLTGKEAFSHSCQPCLWRLQGISATSARIELTPGLIDQHGFPDFKVLKGVAHQRSGPTSGSDRTCNVAYYGVLRHFSNSLGRRSSDLLLLLSSDQTTV